jgi:hypothetical protein
MAPRYTIRDRDRIYGIVVTRRLRAMGIRDKPIAPASPWQGGFAERLRDGSKPISRHCAAIKFLCSVYKEAPEPGSHSYDAIRISLRSGILKRPQPRRRCVSSCDVLDLLGYVLVAVFQRRLVHDDRFASGR